MWTRACELDDTELILLLGEATFHQIHGGVATNALESPWRKFHDEYVKIGEERSGIQPEDLSSSVEFRIKPWLPSSGRRLTVKKIDHEKARENSSLAPLRQSLDTRSPTRV